MDSDLPCTLVHVAHIFPSFQITSYFNSGISVVQNFKLRIHLIEHVNFDATSRDMH